MMMTETDYIRAAVELADGWYITHIYAGEDIVAWTDRQHPPSFVLQSMDQWGLDALAAQLVRQVDALAIPVMVIVSRDGCSIVQPDETYLLQHPQPGDRTMNTIKAIVDSGILK